MIQKILDALKTRFEGVDEKVLSRIANKLAKTVTTEEGVQPAVDGVTFQQVIDAEADRRATEATQTAVSNYEKKHGLKDGQKAEPGTEPTKTEPNKEPDDKTETPAWAKVIIESNKVLSEKLTALEGEKVETTRKQKLDAVISSLPDNLKKPYSRISLKDMTEDEFDEFVTETTTEVGGLVADFAAKGAALGVPTKGGSFTKKEPSKEETTEVVSSLI
ncbi:MAG: hypothetical protein LBF08_07075 [Dysgonamonadaceae bacterium]|jgi:hypothetical protein|nr:hypothetical protein [Dysgonamonadaceae bacterium]